MGFGGDDEDDGGGGGGGDQWARMKALGRLKSGVASGITAAGKSAGFKLDVVSFDAGLTSSHEMLTLFAPVAALVVASEDAAAAGGRRLCTHVIAQLKA